MNARDRYGQTPLQLAELQDCEDDELRWFVAAGADMSDLRHAITIDADQVEKARHNIAKVRLDFVRDRALEVCIGLELLRLDALQMCEILQHACGPIARLVAFHHWWKIATAVKHFHEK